MEGATLPALALCNLAVPLAVCSLHGAHVNSLFCWPFCSFDFCIDSLAPLSATMVLVGVNVVLSTELAREGWFFVIAYIALVMHTKKQTAARGLLDMPDIFWMRCQELVYPEDVAQARQTVFQNLALQVHQ